MGDIDALFTVDATDSSSPKFSTAAQAPVSYVTKSFGIPPTTTTHVATTTPVDEDDDEVVPMEVD